MKVQQAKILLEKINRHFQSMTMDEHISEIEKDLMRSYIKSLYEEFLPRDGTKVTPIVEPPKVVAPPPRVVERIVEAPPKAKVEKVVQAPPPPKVVVQPEPEPEPMPEPEPTPVIVKQPEPVVRKTRPVSNSPAQPSASKGKVKEEHEILFEQKEAKELSEKLSQQPIKDLRKAMGINERILTTNELFDGNGDALKDALNTLNGLNNFDEAKDYLSNIAEIYDWTNRKKKKKAQNFIKLVRRRFN